MNKKDQLKIKLLKDKLKKNKKEKIELIMEITNIELKHINKEHSQNN